jgi:hypothetical protein
LAWMACWIVPLVLNGCAPPCGCCNQCTTCDQDKEIQITLALIANDSCTDCTGINASYLLPFFNSPGFDCSTDNDEALGNICSYNSLAIEYNISVSNKWTILIEDERNGLKYVVLKNDTLTSSVTCATLSGEVFAYESSSLDECDFSSCTGTVSAV